MSKEDIKPMLALIKRSPDQGDGWRKVSKTCWPLLSKVPDDLAEREPDGEGGGRVRMTSKGEAVLMYA